MRGLWLVATLGLIAGCSGTGENRGFSGQGYESRSNYQYFLGDPWAGYTPPRPTDESTEVVYDGSRATTMPDIGPPGPGALDEGMTGPVY